MKKTFLEKTGIAAIAMLTALTILSIAKAQITPPPPPVIINTNDLGQIQVSGNPWYVHALDTTLKGTNISCLIFENGTNSSVFCK